MRDEKDKEIMKKRIEDLNEELEDPESCDGILNTSLLDTKSDKSNEYSSTSNILAFCNSSYNSFFWEFDHTDVKYNQKNLKLKNMVRLKKQVSTVTPLPTPRNSNSRQTASWSWPNFFLQRPSL